MKISKHVPNKYSCAVDCFLELWVNILGNIKPIRRGFNKISSIVNEYSRVMAICSGVSAFSIFPVHEIIWSYLREKCPTLMAIDCNAVFIEMFAK